MDRDYYSVLGVAPQANAETIAAAYRNMALKCHPDCGGSHREMSLLNQAWRVLSDPEQRARYDRTRADEADTESSAEQGSDQEDVAAANDLRFEEVWNRYFGNSQWDEDDLTLHGCASLAGQVLAVGGVLFWVLVALMV